MSTTVTSVLVVEDNPVNQVLAIRQLERLGHRGTVAATATEGLRLLADHAHGFDVVLMDWQLPDFDGLEATRRLRAIEDGTGRRTPVVAVTASALLQDRAACFAAGMDDFVPKPVVLADLGETIARWI